MLHDPSRIREGVDKFALHQSYVLGCSQVLRDLENLPGDLDKWLDNWREKRAAEKESGEE